VGVIAMCRWPADARQPCEAVAGADSRRRDQHCGGRASVHSRQPECELRCSGMNTVEMVKENVATVDAFQGWPMRTGTG